MREKPTILKKLKSIADSCWSKKIRGRDKECVLCGSKNALQAHHWILTKKQSSKYRYDLRNGVTLCFSCHIRGVHNNPSAYLLDRLKKLCIARGIVSQEDIDEIEANAHEICKRGVGEMKDIIASLSDDPENLSGEVNENYGDDSRHPHQSGELK